MKQVRIKESLQSTPTYPHWDVQIKRWYGWKTVRVYSGHMAKEQAEYTAALLISPNIININATKV